MSTLHGKRSVAFWESRGRFQLCGTLVNVGFPLGDVLNKILEALAGLNRRSG